MSSHSEHDQAPQAEEQDTGPSKAELIQMKLKIVAHYAMLGFAPALALVALIVAIVAVTGNRSSQAQFGDIAAKLESANANLAASRSELERLHITISQLKAQQEDGHKKQDELIEKIVRDVSKLQVKMKVSPTLEEQLHQPASAAAAASVAVPEHAPPPAAGHVPLATPAPSHAPAASEKSSPQKLQGIKEAIEKFNKK